MGTIQGGGVRNAVAAETRVEGEVRSLAPSRAEDVARTIGETFQSVAAAAGASASVELTEQYVGYTLGADEPVVRLASQAFAALGTGRASELVPSGGGSDANELNARGVRACVLGIGATNCHSTAESIGVAQLQLLARWVQEILRLAARG
jgi:tripeptide aminopeptidase